MTGRGDGKGERERAVTVQIGAVILFGFLIVALSTYQATVVPDQNREVEFLHNQEVQTDMVELSASIAATGRTGDAAPATVKLGTRFPSRTLFVNPPPASGRLSTVPPPGAGNISLENVDVNSPVGDEANDYWSDASNLNKSTRFVVYEPRYSNYREAPTTRYESGVTFNRFSNGANLTLTDQRVVEDDRITLIAVSGDLGRNGVSTVSVNPEAVSTVSRRERVAGTLNVTIPTTLNATRWEELLADEIDDGWVNGTHQNGSNRVTIELNDSRTYSLGIAAVHVGSGDGPDRSPAYLDVEKRPTEMSQGTTREVVVEVRDQFGNPVSGTPVSGVASAGSFGDGGTTTVRTDDRGRAVFEYTATNSDAALDFSYDTDPADGIDPDSPEDARVGVNSTEISGGGNASAVYDLVWDTDRIVSDNDGVTYQAASDTLVVDRADSGSSLQMTARATDGNDSIAGVSVDYASNRTAAAEFVGPESEGQTGNDGRSTVSMDIGSGGQTAKVYASAAQSADILRVRLQNAGGVYYRYYEGDFGNEDQPSDLNLDSRTPVSTGETAQFTIDERQRDDEFAFAYTAYIDVPQDGEYTFYTNSDDGSWLNIDGNQIVDNGGDHPEQETSGAVTLTEGQHNITVYMYENQGDQALDVSWEGPGTGGKQVIPSDVLSPRQPSDGSNGGGGDGGTPSLSSAIVDQGQTGSQARYEVSYDISNTANFDRVEVTFDNLDSGGADATYTSSDPRNNIDDYGWTDSFGGTGGDTYEITIDVYDTNGDVVDSRTVTDDADGADPSGNADLSEADSPTLDSSSLIDTTQNNNVRYTADYSIDDPAGKFSEVEVLFYNMDTATATDQRTVTDASGTAYYSAGGAEDDQYQIIVQVQDDDGIVVDQRVITDQADGSVDRSDSTAVSTQLNNFDRNPGQDRFTVQAQAQDSDGDNDMSRIEYVIVDSNGNVVGRATRTGSGQQIQPGTITISSDSDVQGGETYTAIVIGYDADGNYSWATGTA